MFNQADLDALDAGEDEITKLRRQIDDLRSERFYAHQRLAREILWAQGKSADEFAMEAEMANIDSVGTDDAIQVLVRVLKLKETRA